MAARTIRDDTSYARFIEYVRECGLETEMRIICLRHSVTPRDIYLDTQGYTVYAARIEVWWWLSSYYRKSTTEIGRMFDREGTSIVHALRKLRERATALGFVLTQEDVPHNVAMVIAGETESARRRAGEQSALRFAAKRAKKPTGGGDE